MGKIEHAKYRLLIVNRRHGCREKSSLLEVPAMVTSGMIVRNTKLTREMIAKEGRQINQLGDKA